MTLTDDDPTPSQISVRIKTRQEANDIIGIDLTGGSIALSDRLRPGSRISIKEANIWKDIGGLNSGAGYGQLSISLNADATPERVQTLLQALTYYTYEILRETLQVEIAVSDPGGRKSVSTVTVIREDNEAPGSVTLDSATSLTVAENTAFSGLLSATDDLTPAGDLTFSFDPSAPGGGNAGGLFVIEGGRLKLAPGRSLDYEALPAGQKSVSVYVKATDSEDGVGATQAITINVTNDVQDDSTDGPDVLIGGDKSEILNGKGGNDVIRGNGGDDTLSGGAGKDTLDGGAGKDIFVFDAKLAKTNKLNKKQNLDKVLDFVVADDTIHLAKSVFSKITKKGVLKKGEFFIGSAAHDRDDRVIYNKKTGALSYDADGNGAKEAIQFATLAKNLKLTNLDLFVV